MVGSPASSLGGGVGLLRSCLNISLGPLSSPSRCKKAVSYWIGTRVK